MSANTAETVGSRAASSSLQSRTVAMSRLRRGPSVRHRYPVVEVQDDGRIVAVARAARKGAAGLVLGRDRAQPQHAEIAPAGEGRGLQHLAPGIDGVAG